MTWVKFEDRFPWHRKVRGLSDSAFRLHVSAVCWSVEHLTDGKVDADDLPLVSDIRRPMPAAAELERKGLWDVLPDGWQIHDFLTYNEPRVTVQARREADAERKRRGRDSRTPRGFRPDIQPESGGTPAVPARPVPNRPEPTFKTSPSSTDDAHFDEFWNAYPRKVGKTDARKAYRKALTTTGWAAILKGALTFRDDPNREAEFTPHPATWLNAGRWDDEPLPVRGLRSVQSKTDRGDEMLRRWHDEAISGRLPELGA